MFIPTTRSEYKINKGKFYLRLLYPFLSSQITKVALKLNAGSPSLARPNVPRSLYLNRVPNNLADRNVARLAPTRWGQIKHELGLSIHRLLYKNRYIIDKAKHKIYSTTRINSKRILDAARSKDSEIQLPLHPRARVNPHQRVGPQRHGRRDGEHVQLLKAALHRTQNCLAMLVQLNPTREYSRNRNPSSLCPQFLSL